MGAVPITAVVPVYNAAPFVRDTLDSLVAQTLTEFRVRISVDRCDDGSAEICRTYERDARFRVVVQPHRLDWVRNVNTLIAGVDTPFFCIVPHDDLLAPTYLERLLALMDENDSAACAYSDLKGFGFREPYIQQADVRGTQYERVLDLLLNHFPAVAFRGLVRRRTAALPLLPTDLPGNFAADTVWMMRLALAGELRRLPEPLYAKRYGSTSVHAGWFTEPRAVSVQRWTDHAVACVRIALTQFSDPDQVRSILAAGLIRAVGTGRVAQSRLSPRSAIEVARSSARYCAAFGLDGATLLRHAFEHDETGVLKRALRRSLTQDPRGWPQAALRTMWRVVGT